MILCALIGCVNNTVGQISKESLTLRALSDSVSQYRATDADKALTFNREKMRLLKEQKLWKEYVEASVMSITICFNLNKLQLIPNFLSQLSNAIKTYETSLASQEIESFKQSHRNYHILLNQKTGKNQEAYRMIEEDIHKRSLKKQFTRLDTNAFFFNYYSLSIICFKTGEYPKALGNCQKALNILLKVPQYNRASELLLYETLGQICLKMGDLEATNDYWNKAAQTLSQAEKQGIKSSDLDFNATNFLLSKIERELTNNDIVLAEQTLEKIKQYVTPQTPNDIIRLKLVGRTCVMQQQFNKADSVLQQALLLGKTVFGERNNFVAQLYSEMSALYLKKNDTLRAIKELQNALIAASSQFNNSDINTNPAVTDALSKKEMLDILNAKSTILLQISEKQPNTYLTPTFETTQSALNLLNNIRTNYTVDFDKVNLLSTGYPIFEKSIRTAFLRYEKTRNTTYLEAAYQAAEQSKATVLFEGLKSVEAEMVLSEEVRNQLFQVRTELTNLEKKRNDEKNKTLDNLNYQNLQSEIFETHQKFEDLVKTFEIRYPNYYNLKFEKKLTSSEQIKTILKPNQTLLEYFVGDNNLYAFVINPHFYQMIEIKKDFPLDNWVKILRGSLNADSFKTQADIYADMAYKLYEKLIKPIKSHLLEEVIIIPDGILGYIPFEALLTQKPEKAIRFRENAYLLREHSISYSFSATLLREMMQKKHRQEPTKSLIAYAPFFDGDTTVFSKILEEDLASRRDFVPLFNSGEEAYRISKIMKGEAFIGKNTTENKFTETASKARILHLATHGKANDRIGDYSYLAFSPIKDSIENELLFVGDIYSLTLNADMVVLSACETGIGKLQRGEGIISLARAFAYAGAKSIITSLWAVNDTKTKDLMVSFYKNLRKGKSKSEALREAKLSLIDKNLHPYYWAGFIGIGDMSKLR